MDPILFWNDVALEANRISHTNGANEQTGPTLSARALCIVHLAMYDAFAAVSLNPADLPFYMPGLPAPPPGASVEAATAGAAHKALVALFPSQASFFDLKLAMAGSVLNPGHAFGVSVAQRLLEDRDGDPGAGSEGYVASNDRGRHRPDPDNPQGFHAPFYGARCKGFAIKKRWELEKPPFDDAEYKAALKEVLGLGIAPDLMGTLPSSVQARSAEQTLIGIYWGYDGAKELGTPPRLYNQIVRTVAANRGTCAAENARLFALVNAAMADAGILAWDQKYIHDLWRPVVGIREHDRSMGPAAAPADAANPLANNCDPGWLPLGAPKSNELAKNFTPPFPAYPSGHATFGAAALHITRLFFHKKDKKEDDLFKDLSFVSEELNGITRDNRGTQRPRHQRAFPDGLWQMIEENGRSRVYLGVHWVFDAFAAKNGKPDLSRNIGGVPLGLTIAEDIFNGGRNKGLKKSEVPPRT